MQHRQQGKSLLSCVKNITGSRKSASTAYAGMGAGSSVNGQYSGYKGIYNFYNIGASDRTNAVANGLKWANTGILPETVEYTGKSIGRAAVEKSILMLGRYYIFSKFNVINAACPVYTSVHDQYMDVPQSASTMTAYTGFELQEMQRHLLFRIITCRKTTNITIGSNSKQVLLIQMLI